MQSTARRTETLTPDLVATLRGILATRPAEARHPMVRCECIECEAARRAPFRCEACGFAGQPTVFPCDCQREHDETVRIYATWIREPAQRPRDLSRRSIQRALARVQSDVPVVPCDGSRCPHGARTCPSCGATSSGDEPFRLNGGTDDAAALLREIRTALAMVRDGARGEGAMV